jgi:hypothetical protein
LNFSIFVKSPFDSKIGGQDFRDHGEASQLSTMLHVHDSSILPLLRHVNISVLGSLLTDCHGELLYLSPRIALPEEDVVDEIRPQRISGQTLFPPDASVHLVCIYLALIKTSFPFASSAFQNVCNERERERTNVVARIARRTVVRRRAMGVGAIRLRSSGKMQGKAAKNGEYEYILER